MRPWFAPEGAVGIWTVVSGASEHLSSIWKRREWGRRKINAAMKQSRDLRISIRHVKQGWQGNWKLPGGMNKQDGKKAPVL